MSALALHQFLMCLAACVAGYWFPGVYVVAAVMFVCGCYCIAADAQ